MSGVNKIMSYVATRKFWVELLIMTVGMIFTAVCVHYFLVPSKLIVGSGFNIGSLNSARHSVRAFVWCPT